MIEATRPSAIEVSDRALVLYVFVRRGLGEYPAFVVGWSDWISTCASVSLGAMVFTEYLEVLVPALGGRRAISTRPSLRSGNQYGAGPLGGHRTSARE